MFFTVFTSRVCLYGLTYPSGRTITYMPNVAGQMVSAEDTANSINYATGAVYTPPGSLASLTNSSSPSLVSQPQPLRSLIPQPSCSPACDMAQLAAGKNKGVLMTAVGRELLGFIWSIGIKA